ncbi:putative chloroplast RF2 protein [Corchorus olitorius]|uniref:Chloroplast RF2 protein n=1 Tax=Corchorus olitorius TaxID=93759 RepID=A0A1R3KZN4_9ROSI|nr:putative chloroplast RF2 protein [Corchorus olitorius]OMP13890.1 putative chloroplast RF2 protein [Corchorus olitorius]
MASIPVKVQKLTTRGGYTLHHDFESEERFKEMVRSSYFDFSDREIYESGS